MHKEISDMKQSNHPRLIRAVVVGLATGGLALGVPAAASAAQGSGGVATANGVSSHPTCSPTTFAAAQQRVERDLASRLTELGSLTGDVQAAADLTTSDRSALSANVSSATSGIQALAQKVPTDTTCAALWPDARSMVQTYRVFTVVAPQTHLVIAADTASSVESRAAGLDPTIQSAISQANLAGKDVTGAQSAFTDLAAQIAQARSLTGGVSATALAQTPAGYPASSAVFAASRDSLKASYGDLETARSDLQLIIKDLG
jgi:hypothetical protein